MEEGESLRRYILEPRVSEEARQSQFHESSLLELECREMVKGVKSDRDAVRVPQIALALNLEG